MIFDKVIANCILADPEDLSLKNGHLAINGDKIAAISTQPLAGTEIYDAAGQVLSPGFIDMHGHVDGDARAALLSLKQGITTTVGGNCGHSPINLAEFFQRQQTQPLAINQAVLMGMTSSLREAVGITSPLQKTSREELKKMQYLVEQAFSDGAAGLSIGLAYAPLTSDEEIYTLSAIAARYGRLVAVDTRMKTPLDLYSLVEVINISRQLGVRTQISHFVYQYGAGLVAEGLSAIDKARKDGLDVRLDSGMYTQWATGLRAVLFDPDYMKDNSWDPSNILIATGPYKGQRLNHELYRRLRENLIPEERLSVIVFTGKEDEIYTALSHPWCMPSTDIGRYRPGEGHPQIAGSFPRYFRKMVREKKLLSLPEAVRKATLLPAQTLGLKERGRLRVGCFADLAVFDIKTLEDRAGFLPENLPDAEPEGISFVFVNGQLALEHNTAGDLQAGRHIVF